MAVDVLACPTCAAPVPIGDDDPARCVHCGARVPLPGEHRALRDAARLDASARARGERLLHRLATPPWLITRILARILDQPMVAFWLFFGIPVGLFSILGALAMVGDDGSFPAAIAVVFALIFVMTFVPRALGVYANRRATARARLVAGLRARPPSRPGGPAGCRNCGAPLAVPPDALLVRCLYCSCDNLVRARAGEVATSVRAAQRVASTVEGAAAGDRAERSHTRRQLLHELLRYLATTAVFAGLSLVYAVDYERPAVKEGGATPALGIAALVLLTLLLIALMLRSLARSGASDDEARGRREGNDVPAWVGVAGPIGIWVLIWIVLRLAGR